MKSSFYVTSILTMICFQAVASENFHTSVLTVNPDTDTAHNINTLPGNYGGKRSALQARGYDLQIVYKLDLLNNISTDR